MSHFLSFWDHFEDLRQTMIRMALCLFLGFIFFFSFHERLQHFLLAPLQQDDLTVVTYEKKWIVSPKEKVFKLPVGARLLSEGISSKDGTILLKANAPVELEVPRKGLYFFSPLEGFLIAAKLSFWASLTLTSPVWLFFLSRFLLPALKKSQRKWLLPFILLSFSLIGLGMACAYWVTLPFVGCFFKSFNEKMGENFWGVHQTTDLALSLILGHGLVFEIYAVLLFVIQFRILSYESLKKGRRYVIVLSLILGAILTPPDVLSQIALALPMILLYEAAVLWAFFKKDSLKKTFTHNAKSL